MSRVDFASLPLNRAHGNAECSCGAGDDDNDIECPFTLVADEVFAGEPCGACSADKSSSVHGPVERCHGMKLHHWTLGDGGCAEDGDRCRPSSHHAFVQLTSEDLSSSSAFRLLVSGRRDDV